MAKRKIRIYDSSAVYGVNNKKLTGVQTLDEKDAKWLVDNKHAEYVDEPAVQEPEGKNPDNESLTPDETWTVAQLKDYLGEGNYPSGAKKDELLKLALEESSD
ncbi:MAG: hypothetical protein Kow0098_03620 [Ignavibacteriaceae bacterium]